MATKCFQDRYKEIVPVYSKLRELGISDQFTGITEFFGIANEFVKNGTASSGRISIPELDRVIIYKLSNKSHIRSEVVFKSKN